MENIDFILIQEGEMNYGLQVNDYDQAILGSYGYCLKLDVSEYKPKSISFLQASAEPLVISDPVTAPVALATLQGYPEDENCPDLAYCFLGETLHVFFKESVYPYADDDCRFAFGGIRYPMLALEDTVYVDVPDQYLDLVILFAREMAWASKKLMVDKDIATKLKNRIHEIETE